jgi:hypothetical protein
LPPVKAVGGGPQLPHATLARMTAPLLLLTAVGVSLRPGLENDAWWHLASGRWMLEHRAWLEVDVFSWTVQGRSWVRPGLVADIVMAWLYGLGGASLLVTLASACFVASFALLLHTVKASPAATLGIGTLCILTAVVAATPRPLVASLTLTAATIAVLERERASAGTRLLWTLPLLTVLWVNTHGAFVILFVLVGCHGLALLVEGLGSRALGRSFALGRIALAGGVSLLAVPLNPFGARMLLYPFETLQLGVLEEFIHEWRRPVLTDVQFWPLFALVAVSAFALLRADERRRPADVVLLVTFGGLALTAARHGAIFALVAFPIVPRLLSRREPLPAREAWSRAAPFERRVEASLLVVVAVLTSVVVSPALTASGNERAIAAFHGERAAARAATGALPGQLWNSYDLGGYVIWHGTPDVLVSMDSRTDLYGDQMVREHIAEWLGERDAPTTFPARGIEAVLVERRAPLVAQLEDGGWLRIEEDHHAVLLQAPRRTAGS